MEKTKLLEKILGALCTFVSRQINGIVLTATVSDVSFDNFEYGDLGFTVRIAFSEDGRRITDPEGCVIGILCRPWLSREKTNNGVVIPYPLSDVRQIRQEVAYELSTPSCGALTAVIDRVAGGDADAFARICSDTAEMAASANVPRSKFARLCAAAGLDEDKRRE